MAKPKNEAQEIPRFLYLYEHLLWRIGRGVLPEQEFGAECWTFPVPDRALDFAMGADSSSHWCLRLVDAFGARGWR